MTLARARGVPCMGRGSPKGYRVRMRTLTIPAALASAPAWTVAPDGLSARIEDAGHAASLSCSPGGGLRVGVDAPPGTDGASLDGREGTLVLRGATAGGTFSSDLAVDGSHVLFLRDGGVLRVGEGDGAFGSLADASDAIDRIARGCGHGS